MIYALFTFIAACHLFISIYFVDRFLFRRQHTSLICALHPLGWVLVIARELRWLPRPFTTPLIAASLTMGIFAVCVILYNEAQQVEPFWRRWRRHHGETRRADK